jgi:hypothetical protein
MQMLNAHQLSEVLSEQITKLRSGKVKPQVSNAIVSASGKLLAIQRLTLDYAKATKQTPDVPFLTGNGKAKALPRKR